MGIDVVDLDRFAAVLARRPSVVDRMFVADELVDDEGTRLVDERLAARFAAKEAVMKALGVGLGSFPLTDVVIGRAPSGQPVVRLAARAAEVAAERGVTEVLLSMSHDGPVATAMAVAQ